MQKKQNKNNLNSISENVIIVSGQRSIHDCNHLPKMQPCPKNQKKRKKKSFKISLEYEKVERKKSTEGNKRMRMGYSVWDQDN